MSFPTLLLNSVVCTIFFICLVINILCVYNLDFFLNYPWFFTEVFRGYISGIYVCIKNRAKISIWNIICKYICTSTFHEVNTRKHRRERASGAFLVFIGFCWEMVVLLKSEKKRQEKKITGCKSVANPKKRT